MNLDLLTRFKEIEEFLIIHQDIIKIEFLKTYPSPFPEFLLPWLKEMENFDDMTLSIFESKPHENLVTNTDFKSFLKKARELGEIPISQKERFTLPSEITRGMTEKKEHELSLLKPYLDKSKQNQIIDIGGGAAHTSFSAVYKTSKVSICVDQDQKLLNKGIDKLKKLKSIKKEQISFVQSKISKDSPYKVTGPNLTLGLHSCGDLSVDIINENKEKKNELILFACCFHKIKDGLFLSKASKDSNLKLSLNALHLASRSSKIVGPNEIVERKVFKKYRYCLHYYLYDRFKLPFKSFGNSSTKTYQLSFSKYALAQDLGIKLDEDDLEEFYKLRRTQRLFRDNFNADEIRLLLGRLIELYIVLDRALYLREHGHKVQVTELFDRSLSPRNIMLKSTPL